MLTNEKKKYDLCNFNQGIGVGTVPVLSISETTDKWKKRPDDSPSFLFLANRSVPQCGLLLL